MNVESLHAIGRDVVEDLKKYNIVPNLQAISSSLQQMAQQPNQPGHQQNFANQYAQLQRSLESSAANDYPPIVRQSIAEFGLSNLYGLELKRRVDEIVQKNSMTPIVAHQELNKIYTELSQKFSALEQMLSAFKVLNVGDSTLRAGECELSYLIPKAKYSSDIECLADELIELKKIFGVFLEIATGSRPDIPVKSIASTDFGFFMHVAPEAARIIATNIDKIVTTFASILAIRDYLKKMHEEHKVPEEALQGTYEHANQKMAAEIDSAVEETLGPNNGNMVDPHRVNELKIEMKLSMNAIANRIDEGFHFGVRTKIIEQPKDTTETSFNKIAVEINLINRNQKHIPASPTNILSLPESPESTERLKNKGVRNKKKRKTKVTVADEVE